MADTKGCFFFFFFFLIAFSFSFFFRFIWLLRFLRFFLHLSFFVLSFCIVSSVFTLQFLQLRLPFYLFSLFVCCSASGLVELHLIFLLLGCGFLTPYNAIILAADYYAQLFPRANLQYFFPLLMCTPNLLVPLVVLKWGQSWAFKPRIIWPFLIETILLSMTAFPSWFKFTDTLIFTLSSATVLGQSRYRDETSQKPRFHLLSLADYLSCLQFSSCARVALLIVLFLFLPSAPLFFPYLFQGFARPLSNAQF